MSELAKALVQFQKKTAGFEADKQGNRSKYASIGAVISNVKQAAVFGLAFTQEVDFEGQMIFVRTVMLHESGETRESRYPVIVDDMTNNQKLGGAITYAKRYALASMFGTEKGVEDADDDGEINGLYQDPPKEQPLQSSSPEAGAPPAGEQPSSAGDSNSQEPSLEDQLAQCNSEEELRVLINQIKPRDASIIAKFTKRKEEINGSA